MGLLLIILAVVFQALAYYKYFLKTWKSTIAPNKWSWLIWSITTAIETWTYHEVSSDWFKTTVFLFSSVCCLVTSILIWKKSKWRPLHWKKDLDGSHDRYEIISITVCLLSIPAWFHSAWWAHVITLTSLVIAFLPTYKNAWENYTQEDTPSWTLWSIGDLLQIGVVTYYFIDMKELPYAVLEFLCHLLVALIVLQRKMRFKKHMLA